MFEFKKNRDEKNHYKNFYLGIIWKWLYLPILVAVLLVNIFSGCSREKKLSAGKTNVETVASYTVTDDAGNTLHFNQKPRRIASYSISTDEILLELVGAGRIIAVSKLSDDPGISWIVKEAKQIPNRVQGNSVEALLTFKPDLVIIPDFHPVEMIQTIQQLGLKVYVYKTPSTIEDVKRSIRQLAEVTGERKKGDIIIAKMEEKIHKVQQCLQSIPKDKRKRVMQLRSEGAVYAPKNSFGDVCRKAGVSDATLELNYPNTMEIAQEKVLELNPDVIFVPAWNYDGKHEPVAEKNKILSNPSYKGLKAVREGKVYSISGAFVLTVSQYIADAVVEVARLSYPEAFTESGGKS